MTNTLSAPPMLDLSHVSCSYGGPAVVDHVDLRVRSGELVGLVGPSGSGKTTLLRAILGTVVPFHGTITKPPSITVAYVPQIETVDWNFPVTVSEVILMTKPQRSFWPRSTTAERGEVNDLLDKLGLSGLGGRHIRELSGGQQQRVFLARALACHPDLLVLDEPTSGVDVRTRHEILHLLTDLNAEGLTIVLTTHDLNGLAAHLPRIICLNKTVIADGAPIDVLRPAVLEKTYGAPLEVLIHGGMPVVLDHAPMLKVVGQ